MNKHKLELFNPKYKHFLQEHEHIAELTRDTTVILSTFSYPVESQTYQNKQIITSRSEQAALDVHK